MSSQKGITMKTLDMKQTLQTRLEEDEKLIKFILISFSNLWNIIISIQSYALTLLVMYIFAFNDSNPAMYIFIVICDLFYLCDFIAKIIYVYNAKIRRFLPYKPNNWVTYVLDFVSLVPFAFAYETYFALDQKNDFVWCLLLQNRCLRIYRIFNLLNAFDLTLRDASQYLVLMLVRLIAYGGLLSHLTTCIWANLPQSRPCNDDSAFCVVWQESNMLVLLLHHWAGNPNTLRTTQERILVVFTITCGLFLIYGDFIPYLLLIFMRVSRPNGQYYQSYLKLERYLKNVSVGDALNEKIMKYFRHFWQAGTVGMETEKLMQGIPLALKKEIYTDIYWDAFRHSDILRDCSRSCKRSLSLVMKTEYCQEGDIVCSKGKAKYRMIYLVQGILELMAEENEQSPIMSFSSGTILGEVYLFLLMRSNAIVRCRTLCELQTISLRDIYTVTSDFPKDKNLIFQKFNKRLVIAKITQWRKRRIMIERMMGFDFVGGQLTNAEENEDFVKWVKMQWRAIWETHEHHKLIVKAIEAGVRIPAWRKEHEIQTRLDAISNYMDLMVLSDIFEEKKDVVCLRTVFPWAIDPNAEFLIYWRWVVIAVALIASTLYPCCCGWFVYFPHKVFTISILCTLIFQIDVALILMTAVKTKHGIIAKLSSILINCLKTPTFYFDILAALPYQMYLALTQNDLNQMSSRVGLILLPCLFKAHVFLKPRTAIGNSMVPISLLKNTFIYLLLIYWFATIFQLVSVRCIPYCGLFKFDIMMPLYEDPFVRNNLMSVFMSVSTALSLPDNVIYTSDVYFLGSVTIFNLLFFFWSCFFLADFYIVYSIKISNQLKFKILCDRVIKYLEGTQIEPLIQRRILRIIRFQWVYNRADDLLTKVPIIALAPQSLRREIYHDSIFRTLKKCPLFETESNDLIFDVIEKCNLFAIPAGTILVNYGLHCYRIHMLHKGYCQINSFLKRDVSGGLGTPILIQPGDVFPTLAAFVAAPAPISVLALTDCEILVIGLEDLLKIMITHDMFRDVVHVLKKHNYPKKLSEHMLAMIRVNVEYNVPVDKHAEYLLPFQRLGLFGQVLRHVLIHRNWFYDQNQEQKFFLKAVSLVYFIYLLFNSVFWPLSLGLLARNSYALTIVLTVSKIYAFVFMYLQFHVPYFDKRGLLITHPLYTMWHYLSTTFWFDLLINFPFYGVYHYARPTTVAVESPTMVILLFFQNFLSLIPMNAYLDDITHDSNYMSLFRPMKFLLLLAIILNGLANFEMYNSVRWEDYGNVVFRPSIGQSLYKCNLINPGDIMSFYMGITVWMFGHFTTNNIMCEDENWQEHTYSLACSMVGSIASLLLYGWLASHSAVSDALASMYQERMKSFLEFLLGSKTDDKIVENSVGYFEHQWSRSQGQSIKEICDNLPKHLHEELVYPLYRPTMSKIGLFIKANEGFYRLLSVHVDFVHFNRGSVIFFKGQVQSSVYFIHRGKCFVFDWFETLDVGSMIGDIKRTGIIQNKVYALTHVELLRIESDTFFQIINSFYDVEQFFLAKAERSENFIKSSYVSRGNQLRPVDSRDVLNAFNLQSKDLGFEDQSYFEDPENITTKYTYLGKQKAVRKRFTFIIYPGSVAMHVYNVLHLTIEFVTVTVVPFFFFFGALTWPAFVIIGVLDALWAIVIVATLRVGVEDKVKGDIITSFKFIVKDFVVRWDGFLLFFLTGVPFDMIPVLTAGSLTLADPVTIAWLRSLRLLRGYYLIRYLHIEVNKLKVNSYLRYMTIVVYFAIFINSLVLFYFVLTTNEIVARAMEPFEFGAPQFEAILLVYEYVLNVVTSTNLAILPQDTKLEMLYFNIVSVLSIYVRGLIIKDVLSVKYVYSLARGKYKTQVTLLESYLKKLELSPAILKEVLDYKLNLLTTTRSESMPTFLLSAPTSLQLAIMSDLYLSHLLNSPVFRDVDRNFLKLLVCRLKREMYFPGQVIVEKGDVDNTMYFIHKGEVYVLDETSDDQYIEYIIGELHTGEQFGVAQGLTLSKPHKSTYRARTVVEMLVLHSSDWFDLKISYSRLFRKIVDTAMRLGYE